LELAIQPNPSEYRFEVVDPLGEVERDIDRLLEQHESGRLLTPIDGSGPQGAMSIRS
jgi:hypothetical protein